MEDFGTADVTKDDPAAEFLAREKSALGDLDDEFAFPDNQESQAIPSNDTAEVASNDIKVNGDFIDGDFVTSSGDPVTNGLSNGVSELSLNGGSKPSEPLFLSQPIIPTEEPESIKKWREEHKKALEEKDANEKVKIAELKEQGKTELDDWYKRYEEQLEKAKKQNRTAEKEWITERDNAENGQEWEKITRLCDFNPKTSRNTKDTSRMRSILLQVKQTPPKSSSSSATAQQA